MSRVPQVLVTLSPSGSLVAELPGMNGARRQVELTDEGGISTLRRILGAQQSYTPQTIGMDGKPTQSQVTHWEHHLERRHADGTITIGKSSPTCVWCVAHSLGIDTTESAHRRARVILAEQRRKATQPHKAGNGSVTVRKLGNPDKRIRTNRKDIEVLDFDDVDFSQA